VQPNGKQGKGKGKSRMKQHGKRERADVDRDGLFIPGSAAPHMWQGSGGGGGGGAARTFNLHDYGGDPNAAGMEDVWAEGAELMLARLLRATKSRLLTTLSACLICDKDLGARCSVFNKTLHSRMPLVHTAASLKLLHACGLLACISGVHSLTGCHGTLCHNNEGGFNPLCGVQLCRLLAKIHGC
jgi:hypothetical protein